MDYRHHQADEMSERTTEQDNLDTTASLQDRAILLAGQVNDRYPRSMCSGMLIAPSGDVHMTDIGHSNVDRVNLRRRTLFFYRPPGSARGLLDLITKS